MKQTLFIKTESDIVVIPKLKDASRLQAWKHRRWVKRHLKTKVKESTPRNWDALCKFFTALTLIEQDGNYKIEGFTNLKEKRMSLVKEEIAALNPSALIADGLDEAILGYGQQFPKEPVLIYDYDKCVEVFMEQGMSYEDAIEWMEFNVVNAYYGDGTPIFMRRVEDD